MYLYLLRLGLGGLEGTDKVHIIPRVALSVGETREDVVFNLLQLLLHLGIVYDESILASSKSGLSRPPLSPTVDPPDHYYTSR